MKGLYDIHCHILPGVDDGARNMEESLWMLNKEYQEGVRHVILTPHFRYDMFEPHMNIVTRQFMQLRRAAMNIGDEGMRLYLGCELHSSMDMVECLKKGRRLTLAGSRYVLVEFSNGDEKNYIEERGGKVTGSVTKKTDYLINNEKESNSSKNKKARELNIPLLSEEDFLKLAGEPVGSDAADVTEK